MLAFLLESLGPLKVVKALHLEIQVLEEMALEAFLALWMYSGLFLERFQEIPDYQALQMHYCPLNKDRGLLEHSNGSCITELEAKVKIANGRAVVSFRISLFTSFLVDSYPRVRILLQCPFFLKERGEVD